MTVEKMLIEPLGDPVPDVCQDFLPNSIQGAFASQVAVWEEILERFAPLQVSRVGEVDEDRRAAAKTMLVALALAFRHQKTLLTEVESRIVGWLDEICIDGELIILDDENRLYVGDSPKVTYDNKRTASAFAAKLADEIGKQEETPPVAVIVEEAVRATAAALGGLAPGKGWNQGPLKERGLKQESFQATKERGPRGLKAKQ